MTPGEELIAILSLGLGYILMFAVLIGLPMTVCLGAIILQTRLSQRESRLPGLILPAANFGLSLIVLFGMAMFMVVGTATVQGITEISVHNEPLYIAEHPFNENDAMLQAHLARVAEIEAMQAERDALVTHVNHYEPPHGSVILRMLFVLLIANIPTVILLGIYVYCRKTRNKKQRGLDLMSVQDL